MADNRATLVRKNKLESKQQMPNKVEKKVIKSKINHKKYIKKPGIVFSPKIFLVPEVVIADLFQDPKLASECKNQVETVNVSLTESKPFKQKELHPNVEKCSGDNNDEILSFADSSLNQSKSLQQSSFTQNDVYKMSNASNTNSKASKSNTNSKPPLPVAEPQSPIKPRSSTKNKFENDSSPSKSNSKVNQMNDQTPPTNKFPLVAKNEQPSDTARLPYLYVDVNITDTEMSTIEVYEGDQAENLGK